MTDIVWPPGLPQDVLVEGYDEQMPNVVIRTQMDAGPPKVRRRYTAGIRTLSFSIDLSRDQAGLFDAFFNDTLKGGSLAFKWVHPRTRAVCRLRFTQPPSLRPVSGRLWTAACKMEILP